MVMCFTKYLLEERGHLSRIWLAAHWESKLKRSNIFEINIEKSIKDIISAEIILDLRISGHLLVGVVKIHSKKAQFLLNECSTTFYAVKTFRAGKIDLPEKRKEADITDITLPEYFGEFHNLNDLDLEPMLTTNQSHNEEITLKETAAILCNINEDEISELKFGFDDAECNFLEDLDLISLYDDKKKTVPPPENNITNLTEKEKETFICNEEMMNDLNEIEELGNCEETEADITCCEGLEAKTNLRLDENEKEFFLEPIKYIQRKIPRKMRHLIIDDVTHFSQEQICKQVLKTSDIVRAGDLAPFSKRFMELKEIGGSNQLFVLPSFGHKVNVKLLQLYQQNLKTLKHVEDFKDSSIEDESISFGNASEIELKENDADFIESPLLNHDIQFINDYNICSHKVSSASMEVQISTSGQFNKEVETQYSPKDSEVFISPEEQRMFDIPDLPEQDGTFSSTENADHLLKFKDESQSWESILQTRVMKLFQTLQFLMREKDGVKFSFIIKHEQKIKVAQVFLSLLMLKKFQIIQLLQYKSYDEIFIFKGENFLSVAEICN